ncbi:MAG TPA: protease HtpX [Vicinamibacteria bacterium]|nr:protease HtpX [Vicinamibacteria bacterium]
MAKRIVLFFITNMAIVVTLSIVLSVLGVGRYVSPTGQLDLVALGIFCFVWGMGGAFLSLQISRWTAKRMMGVQLVDGQTGNQDLDWLHNTIGNLARQANLPMPEVGVYDSPEVNAFATGPSKRRSLVAVSTGLLRNMTRDEVQGVLAHEVSHIGNGDMVTMTLLQGVVNAFVMFLARVAAFAVRQAVDSRYAHVASFAVMIVLEIVLGMLGLLVVSAFSRAREFRADAGGAALAGRGAMVGALRRLLATSERVDASQPALASFKIAGGRSFLQLFATHPPLEQRIAALERMA